MDLAAGSAIAAATTIDAALRDADYSQPAMDVYLEHLDAAFVGFDMDTYAKAPAFLKNPRMYKDYGLLLSDVLYGVYNLDTTPRKHLLATGRDALKSSPVTTRRLAEDAVTAIRAL
jgi:electron transfer flavoprotein-quinone oxidoreductase